MRQFLIIIAITLMLTPAVASADCSTLCDRIFYQNATADSVQQLINENADVNAQDKDGKSPLHWAAAAKPEVISALLQAGADVSIRDNLDRTPLHFVSATGSAANITLLIKAGADVNARTANDWTPLHGVAKFGRPENITLLVDAGADASLKTEMGETPYDFAKTNEKMQNSVAYAILQAAQFGS